MKKKSNQKIGFSVLVIVLFLVGFGQEARCFFLSNYAKRSFEKLGRGFTNVAFAPVDIGHSMERSVEKGEFYPLFFIAPARGIAWMMGRILVGTYEIATFWVPQKPILKPPYFKPDIRGYFNETNDKK